MVLAVFLGMAVQAGATSYDPTNLVPPTAQGLVLMNQGGKGDVLLGDFYRATVGTTFGGLLDNAKFLTYVSITNTSDDWVAAHIRLRSGRYSIEIVDFPILLSPRDVFWFQFQPIGKIVENPDGSKKEVLTSLQLWSSDLETIKLSGLPTVKNAAGEDEWLVNLSNTVLDDFALLPAEQKGVQEMAIGYMEVIGLWRLVSDVQLEGGGSSPAITHSMMAGLTFPKLMSDFYNYGHSTLNETVKPAVKVFPFDCPNVLSGQVFMGDFSNGLYTGYTMTALANFRTGCEIVRHRDLEIRNPRNWWPTDCFDDPGAIVYLPISAGLDPAYHDPDWATSFGPTLNDGDDWTGSGDSDLPTEVQSFSLDEVDDALAKATISSTYFNGGFRVEDPTTFSMSILTFPTKYLHVNFKWNRAWPSDGMTYWPVGNPNKAWIVRQGIDVAKSVGSISVYSQIYDLEENFPYAPYSPQSLLPLKYEVNCLPIGKSSFEKLAEFCFLTHTDLALTKYVTYPDYFAGWFGLRGFGLMVGDVLADPRSAWPDYDRSKLPLLHCLRERDDASLYGYDNLIPVLSQTLDWEFGSELPGMKYLPHARAFAPNFDNPNNCAAQNDDDPRPDCSAWHQDTIGNSWYLLNDPDRLAH